jgi:hypothetical protein
LCSASSFQKPSVEHPRFLRRGNTALMVVTFSNDTLLIGTRLVIGICTVVFFCSTWSTKRESFDRLLSGFPAPAALRPLATMLRHTRFQMLVTREGADRQKHICPALREPLIPTAARFPNAFLTRANRSSLSVSFRTCTQFGPCPKQRRVRSIERFYTTSSKCRSNLDRDDFGFVPHKQAASPLSPTAQLVVLRESCS